MTTVFNLKEQQTKAKCNCQVEAGYQDIRYTSSLYTTSLPRNRVAAEPTINLSQKCRVNNSGSCLGSAGRNGGLYSCGGGPGVALETGLYTYNVADMAKIRFELSSQLGYFVDIRARESHVTLCHISVLAVT